MSATTPGRLDLDEQIARIERSLDEAGKLRAEQGKLLSEQIKLLSEAKKFDRDRWIVPLSVGGAVLAAIIARLPEIMAAFGVGH